MLPNRLTKAIIYSPSTSEKTTIIFSDYIINPKIISVLFYVSIEYEHGRSNGSVRS